MLRATPLLSLFALACIGPDNTTICAETTRTLSDICDLELTEADTEQLYATCEQTAGYAQATGCAAVQRQAWTCMANAIAGRSCAQATAAVDAQCAYIYGRVEGCLPTEAVD